MGGWVKKSAGHLLLPEAREELGGLDECVVVRPAGIGAPEVPDGVVEGGGSGMCVRSGGGAETGGEPGVGALGVGKLAFQGGDSLLEFAQGGL